MVLAVRFGSEYLSQIHACSFDSLAHVDHPFRPGVRSFSAHQASWCLHDFISGWPTSRRESSCVHILDTVHKCLGLSSRVLEVAG